MLKRKPLIIAAVTAVTVGVAALSSQAYAHDDALLGALVGAGVGAAIGHNVHGRDGAVVGARSARLREQASPRIRRPITTRGTTSRRRPCTRLHRSTMAQRPRITSLRRSTIRARGST